MDQISNRNCGGTMSGRTILGIALIAIGLLALAYQGFSYTTQKKVVDIGPIQATKEEHHNVPLPPILGAVALLGGVIVVVSGRRGD
jgi:drug/metabolite transporter (DMT)-like permease